MTGWNLSLQFMTLYYFSVSMIPIFMEIHPLHTIKRQCVIQKGDLYMHHVWPRRGICEVCTSKILRIICKLWMNELMYATYHKYTWLLINVNRTVYLISDNENETVLCCQGYWCVCAYLISIIHQTIYQIPRKLVYEKMQLIKLKIYYNLWLINI